MDKKIVIDNNRIVLLKIDKPFDCTRTIREDFIENQEIKKSYHLTQGDDYLFIAFSEMDNDYTVSFDFFDEHPLYMPLLHLLGDDEKLIIDDDDTNEDNFKYLEIAKDTDKIIMTFVDKNDGYYLSKYHVFVKNVQYDLRSKIDAYNLDTKDRLVHFFNEACIDLSQGYHQIEFNEIDKTLYKKIKY